MKSMTGFGAAQALVSHVELEVSVKAVNGRFLDVRLHLPREYSSIESDIKRVVSGRFARGTVDVYIARKTVTARGAGQVVANEELARQWLKALRALGKSLDLKDQPSLAMLLQVPNLIAIDDRVEVTPKEKATVLSLVGKAVVACEKERAREGRALQSELSKLCASLEAQVGACEGLREAANIELERRYRERLVKLGLDGAAEPQRLAQEIVMQLDRADVTEEISRLREHLQSYRLLLKSRDPQGKKLDFYAQELLREVNTIGSKSQVASLTSVVVEAKTMVERIREQVQNVE